MHRPMNVDSAFKYAERGLEAAIAIKNDTAAARAYDVLGRAHHSMGHYLLASKYFERGFLLAQKMNNAFLIVQMRNSLGVSYTTAGQYNEALIYFKEARKGYLDIGKKIQAIQALSNIAALYKRLAQYDKSIIKYEKALEEARAAGKKRYIALCLTGLGEVYEKLGIYDKAFEYQERALAFGEENNYVPQILGSLQRMGSLWVLQGNPDKGKEYYNRALAKAREGKRMSMVQALLMDLGELASKQGNLALATQYFLESLEVAEQMKAFNHIEEVEMRLSEVYAQQNNHLKAYEHALRHAKVKEQIYNENAELRLGELEAKFALERKEEEMKQKEAEIQRLMELEKNKQRQLYALWTVAILFVTLLIALYSRFRIKQKINDVLSHQNASMQQKNDLLEIKTEEIQAQNEQLAEQGELMQAQNAKLRQANSDLEQFAYAASHDLREPLRTISSYIDLLKLRYSDQLDSNAKDFIDYASNGAMRMDDLLKDLLAYSRIGRGSVLSGNVDLNELVQNVSNDLAMQIQEHDAKLEIDDLPTIPGFEAELQLLFQNLINNAIKFRKEGEIPLIQIYATQTKKFWKISIKDNGIGMNPKYHDKVFTIFQRLHSRELYDGTGIGLAICKKIVESHQGSIWFESAEGRGTTFHIKLPQSLKVG